MGTLKFNAVFILLLLFLVGHELVQGFAPHRTESHLGSGFSSVGDRFGGAFDHTVVSKRDVTAAVDIPLPVQQLLELLQKTLLTVEGGVGGMALQKALLEIADLAEKIVVQSGASVLEKDVLDLISRLSPDFLSIFDTSLPYSTHKLHLSLVLLEKLMVRLKEDADQLYETVEAIQLTAEETAKCLEELEQLFGNVMKALDSKRQTTVGAHVDHGPGGTSGGVSASHTWNHGDGSKTTVGGHVDHSQSGGTSGGISVSHSWGRRYARSKRQTTGGVHVNTGPGGTSGGVSVSHTTPGGTTYGGHVDHGPGGTSGGVSASHTWSHGDGSKTTVGGYVDHSGSGGTSGGLSVSHSWGRRFARSKRQYTVGGHVDTGPWGTSGGVSGSYTSGGTTVGGHIDHGPWGTSGGITGSHTVGGTTYGGHVDYGPGGTSGGLSASHSWNLGGGSSATLGGFVDHSSSGGTSGGIKGTINFGR